MPAAIQANHEVPQELRIVGLTRKVVTPAEQQRLRDRAFEPVMGLFDIAVLVAASGLLASGRTHKGPGPADSVRGRSGRPPATHVESAEDCPCDGSTGTRPNSYPVSQFK